MVLPKKKSYNQTSFMMINKKGAPLYVASENIPLGFMELVAKLQPKEATMSVWSYYHCLLLFWHKTKPDILKVDCASSDVLRER